MNYKYKTIMGFTLICVLFLTSCNRIDSAFETMTDTFETEIHTQNDTDLDESNDYIYISNIDSGNRHNTERYEDEEKNADTSEDDSLPHIIWAVNHRPNITEEARAVVQRLIKEKGIPCHVDFIDSGVNMGARYKTWLLEQKANNIDIDILSSTYWERGDLEAAYFVRNEFTPLNDFLKSNDGRAIRECFSENEWKRTEVNGVIYTLPERMKPGEYENAFQSLYVNDQYKDVFEEIYDGTYASLRSIRNMYPDEDLCYVFSGIGDTTIDTFLRCHKFFMLSYQYDTGRFIDLTKQNVAKELLQMMYEDLRDGNIKIEAYLDKLPDNMLFYFMCDNGVAPEGFTKYKFEFYPYISVQAGMYGVSSASSNKDLAFQVLSACYSDPKTASLLYWGYEDADEWNRRTHFFSSVELDPITGFLPELSDEEFDAILRYSRKMDDLRSSLVVQDGRGGWYANPNYLYQLGYFFDHPPDYGDVFEVMNEQLNEWLDNNLE